MTGVDATPQSSTDTPTPCGEQSQISHSGGEPEIINGTSSESNGIVSLIAFGLTCFLLLAVAAGVWQFIAAAIDELKTSQTAARYVVVGGITAGVVLLAFVLFVLRQTRQDYFGAGEFACGLFSTVFGLLSQKKDSPPLAFSIILGGYIMARAMTNIYDGRTKVKEAREKARADRTKSATQPTERTPTPI